MYQRAWLQRLRELVYPSLEFLTMIKCTKLNFTSLKSNLTADTWIQVQSFLLVSKASFYLLTRHLQKKKSKLYVCSFSIRAKKRGSLFINTSHISLSLLHRKIHTSLNCRACVSAHDWRRCSSPCTWPRCSDHEPVRTAPDPPQMWNMWFPTPWSKIGNRIFRF